MAVKRKSHEKLDDDNVALVISLLEQAKPIPKKEAYERLNIAANSVRLQKIIDEYKERRERDAKFRAANRGKPAQPQEIVEVIRGYLDGRPVTEISDQLYRSPGFVKSIVSDIGVPQRTADDYFHPQLLPDQCVREEFDVGELVWAARYQALGIVTKEQPSSNDYKVYEIYVIEKIEEESPWFNIDGYGGRYANQAAFDLGALRHIREHGVDLYKPLQSYFPTMLRAI